MNESFWKPGVPRSILLATDLSGRCDRALDRAVLLARRWNARLVAMTVIEPDATVPQPGSRLETPGWYVEQNPLQVATRRLARDAGTEDVNAAVRVEQGHAGRNLLRVAEEEGCSLVVTGVARHEAFGRMVLGSTVDWLVRHSQLPVLVVRERARSAYRSLVAASDWSPSSKHALESTTGVFPESAVSILHGFDVPFLGMLESSRDSAIGQTREQALADGRAFMNELTMPVGAGDLPRLVVEHGDPARLLRLYAQQYDIDLAVVGTHGRSALFDVVIGSVAKRILEQAPIDVLIVRDPHSKPSLDD